MSERNSNFEAKNAYPQNPFFDTLAVGYFSHEQVGVTTHESDPKPAQLEDLIQEQWEAKGSKSKGLRKTLAFQSPPAIVGGQLRLNVMPSTFREFDVTRDDDVRDKYKDNLVDPVGTAILVVTKDDKLIVVQRPLDSATKPGAMTVISGYPEIENDAVRGKTPDVDGDGNWDPFRTITRELAEETGIQPDEVADVTLTGAIFTKTSKQPVLTFVGKSNLTSDEISKRDTDEEVAVRFVPNSKAVIEDLILTYAPSPSSTGTASLLFYGREQFGEDWFKNVNNRLKEEHQKHMQRTPEQRKEVEAQGITYFLNQSSA